MPASCCWPTLPEATGSTTTSSLPLAPACGRSCESASAWSPRVPRRPLPQDAARPARQGQDQDQGQGGTSSSGWYNWPVPPAQGGCHWTLQLLCDELVALGLTRSIL